MLIAIGLKIGHVHFLLSCCALFGGGTSGFSCSCRLGGFLLEKETWSLPTAGVHIQVHPFSCQTSSLIACGMSLREIALDIVIFQHF